MKMGLLRSVKDVPNIIIMNIRKITIITNIDIVLNSD